ncbi:MAG: ABC transporter permease subunit [Actinomycetota bacterium]
MSSALAAALLLQDGDSPSAVTDDISDNNWLDQYRIPVGSWFEQTVEWIDENLEWALSIIEWPFQILFDILMNPNPNNDSLMSISWLWIVLGFFMLGSFLRNTRVGFMAGFMVFLCGILGREEFDNGVLDGGFWFQTSKTFGMIFVAVLLCTIVGLPLGVMCGRNDGVWNVTRPVLDALQVIHSFVWMLPFVAFWGIGEVSATMVTMMFALPPLVRLTNLGIRQVPEDVVEASRSFGSNEFRVLTDVQLPLARPAIMTGLNQTLLLAISMLGIAAIMGADGLGLLIFRAINNKDTALASAAGLAFFFVAVVLDRITQPEDGDGMSLFGRLSQSLSATVRRNPESLLDGIDLTEAASEAAAPAPAPEEEPAERLVPVEANERMGLLAVAGGSALAIIGALMPWTSDGSVLSSWGNIGDLSLLGFSFSGVNGRGGSWFGITLIVFALVAILAAVRPLVSPAERITERLSQLQVVLLGIVAAYLPIAFITNLFDIHIEALEMFALASLALVALITAVETWVKGTPRLGADGAVIMAVASVALPFGYLFAQGPAGATAASTGIGVYVALIGTLIAAGGGVWSILSAPYASQRPISSGVSLAGIVGVIFALGMAYTGATAAWFVDERAGFRNREFARGLADDGPGLGWPVLILGIVTAAIALLLVGLVRLSETNRWRVGAITSGLGLGIVAIPFAWSMVIAVTGDADYYNDLRSLSGAAVLFALIAGFIFFAMGRSAIKDFRRRKIYADLAPSAQSTGRKDEAQAATDDELVGAGGGS